jgi:predicted aspartyl protease
MAVQHLPLSPLEDSKTMGRVTTTITLTNRADQIRAAEGLISADEVRAVTLENVLVDTGATMLCLPPDIITQLGVEMREEVGVETAAGFRRARTFRDVELSVCGRESIFDCLELPGGHSPLLGVVPMEVLGLEPDLKNQVLRLLPDDTHETYIMAY